MKKSLSIIVPFYNESKSIVKVIDEINQLDINNHLIVINDGSDDLNENVKNIIREKVDVYLENKKNFGKGYSLTKAFNYCKDGYIVIKDADLEYDTQDIKKLYNHALKNNLEVVYGSRFLKKKYMFNKNIFFYGNKFFTYIFNFLYKQNITDAHTCYKFFDSNLLKNLKIHSKRFEFCAEFNSKIAKKNIVINEIPISYIPRSKKEGKKIGVKDALVTLYIYLKYTL